MSDELDLVAYLVSKGVQAHRASGQEVTAHCVFCVDGDTKGKGKLYLNTESWLYDCKRCGERGNRKSLMEHFGDEDTLTYAAGADPGIRRRILQECVDLAHQMLLANDAMLEYLLGRGLTPETIERKRYGYVPANLGFTDMLPSRDKFTYKDLVPAGLVQPGGGEFFNRSLVIPYYSHGQVVQVREKKPDGKYRTLGGDIPRLYNVDTLQAADDVLVTEGEFDCDMVEQELRASGIPALMNTAVVGLPGAGSWPDSITTYFSKARRVFLGLDPDDTGMRFQKKLADEIGARARQIQLPTALPKCDWSDFLNERSEKNPHGGHGWRDIQNLVTQADLVGKRMFSVTDAHLKWQTQRTETPGLQLGWPQIDAIIRPGLKPGQIMIPLAKTGTGKSVFLSNLAHNLSRHRMLYISLELTAEEIFEHLRRIHRFWFPKATPDERDAFYSKLRIVDKNRIGPEDLGNYIEEFAEEMGDKPEIVVVDYLQYYARGFKGDNYTRVSDATMELKATAKDHMVSLIVPSQVNRGAEDGKPLTGNDARDSGVIEETGDFVMSLFRPDQLQQRDGDGTLGVQTGSFNSQLLKSRHGGKGRVFNLRFSNMSLVIVDALDRKNTARVEQENTLARQGLHYEDYRRQIEDEAAQEALL